MTPREAQEVLKLAEALEDTAKTLRGLRHYPHADHVDQSGVALRAYAALLAQQTPAQILDRARAAMSIAMDALESDSDIDNRRKAFEILQGQFEGVTAPDYENLIPELQAEHAQWEASGHGLWPTSPARQERP